MSGGKFKKARPRYMIEWMTCKKWVDLESCKGLTEMSQSERNKLVFDYWKCMMDEKVKIADINMKMEEEIKRLEAEVLSVRRELEYERKLKGDVRSKRKVNGDVNDGVSFLDMDDLILAGCFMGDGVHLSQEGETKLSQRFIRWIRATHLLMEGRMD
ncbi:hypothetical protein FHG87_016785 [Trinorchestia longiramus]|nr:hypothetical protein FHG87_016785 [Trinorchestia longiramus]